MLKKPILWFLWQPIISIYCKMRPFEHSIVLTCCFKIAAANINVCGVYDNNSFDIWNHRRQNTRNSSTFSRRNCVGLCVL